MPNAARVGDMHTCPMSTGPVPHVGGPVMPSGSPDIEIEFLPAARTTDKAACAAGGPDTLAMGCGTVFFNNQLAVRVGDQTAHGGVVVKGAATVEIGLPGDGVAVMPIGATTTKKGEATKRKPGSDTKKAPQKSDPGKKDSLDNAKSAGPLTSLIIECGHPGGESGHRHDSNGSLMIKGPDTLTFHALPGDDGVTFAVAGAASGSGASASVPSWSAGADPFALVRLADAQPRTITVTASKDGSPDISRQVLVYPSDELKVSFSIGKTMGILSRAFYPWFYWIDRICGKQFEIGEEGLELSVDGVKISVPYPKLEIAFEESWDECKFEEDGQLWWECKFKRSGSISVALAVDLTCPLGGAIAALGGPGLYYAYEAFAPYLNKGEDPLFLQLHFGVAGAVKIPDGGELSAEASLSVNAQITAKIICVEVSGKASIAAAASIKGSIDYEGKLGGDWYFGQVAGTISFKVVTGWIWVSETSYEDKLVVCQGWTDTFPSLNLIEEAKGLFANGE